MTARFSDAATIANLANQLQQEHQRSQDDNDEADSANGTKRKAGDDGAQPHQRARRNRYVSIACNECKRRKIKCNGQTPCQRCGNLNLECVYTPNCCTGFKESHEYKEMSDHITALQDQVQALYEGLHALRTQVEAGQTISGRMQLQPQTPIDPSLQAADYQSQRISYSDTQASPGLPGVSMSPGAARRRSRPESQQPAFRGPTSSVFNLGVAKNSLQTMGITSQFDEDINSTELDRTGNTDVNSATTSSRQSAQLIRTIHEQKDPMWHVSREEALRLCRVYEDEMGLMYPFLDIQKVIAHTTRLFQFMEAIHRSGLMQQGMPGADSIDDEDTNILKMLLATAMTVEASGRSDLGQRFFERVQPAIDQMLLGNIDVKAIRLLVMTAMYEFHRDNEGTSWRIIGLSARLCIELGLHRRETYDAIQDESERSETILLFWTIYVLDRRWSFGTGMPFALQDSDIDPQLPKPEDRSPYLSAMIQYSAISSKVWRSIAVPSSPSRAVSNVDSEGMGYLDYQVVQWHRNIPVQLRFEHPSESMRTSTPVGPAQSRAGHRLRIILYLRANQMRILIYRPVLHSATSIMQHREQAQTVVDVAKDTIRVLTHTNQTSDLYRTQQMLFNAFLTSGLAVLFLAVSHAPAVFAENVREEFYMALELVKGFSKGSWVSKRLWKTIRVLKEVGPKLGLVMKDYTKGQSRSIGHDDDVDPSRSAAMAMAGLAGHNVDEMSLYGSAAQQDNWLAASGSSSSPENMVHDLTSLFEAANNFAVEGLHGDDVPHGIEGFTTDEGLSNILRELF